MKQKFGLMGEPLFLGVVIGCVIGAFARYELPKVLMLGVQMGAVMELIPRVTVLFIEGLRPISEATRSLIARKFKNADGLSIGMSPALVIGHPTTLVVSLLLIPVTLVMAVVLPGNEFLPLASLAGMFYIFPLVLPFTRGSVLKTFIVGLIIMCGSLYMVTNIAPWFSLAASDVYASTGDSAVAVPEGFSGGSLDFAGSPMAWIIFKLLHGWRWIGAGVAVACTMGLMIWNRLRSRSARVVESIN